MGAQALGELLSLGVGKVNPGLQEDFLKVYGLGATVGVLLPWGRTQESEADRIGLSLMAKAGYEPAAIARFFALLEEKLGDKSNSNIFSTHPGTPQRRKEITDYARILSGQSDPDLQ